MLACFNVRIIYSVHSIINNILLTFPPSQTYYGADGIDIESVTDETQRAAMRAMVKTYGQMPQQLFRDYYHPNRTKSGVLTSFRMRLGTVLKKLTSNSPYVKITSQYFWMYLLVHRAKITFYSSDCDFIGAQGGTPDMQLSHLAMIECDKSPEKLVYIGGGELVVKGQQVLFIPSSSPSNSTLLIQWGVWDNSILVRTMASDGMVIRLPSHPFNKVTTMHIRTYVYIYLST